MAETWRYPIDVRQQDGEFHAYSVDLPEAIASGPTKAAALDEMGNALAAAIRGRIKDAMELTPPSNPIAAGGDRV